ncbi:hypothetical protein ASPCADRAFT_134384 [Aspergillus carbonarius ITEM 5010]|uniref:Heterokaryon incompatibility domain-containing protein n=1 Tax=Aspergillus carbonarius (strain ITEM 5010) TaxID=602072 RepID=A0A1R3RA64_ASPC5|nr:hypothetical protein ASPCADRAFT_134384 [Aspergillus carbonarius ITEM 5010]
MAEQEFKHQRLSSSDPNIFRIATLLRQRGSDGSISCTIREARLDEATTKNKYKAISHSWGSIRNQPKRGITLNGTSFQIVDSAHRLLEHLYNSSQDDVDVWMDLLCIDQGRDEEATKEKTRQVKIMGQIYEQSEEGVVWLGDPDDGSAEMAIGLLGEFNEQEQFGLGQYFIEEDGRHLVQSCYLPQFYALRKLFNASWWTRIWVVQEMVLPPRIQFRYAHQTFEYETLENVHRALIAERSRNDVFRNLLWGAAFKPLMRFEEVVTPMITTRQAYHEGGQSRQKLTLPVLRQRFAASDASWKQDFFYGLLGMVHWERATPLEPDYTIPAMQAIRKAVMCCVEENDDVSFLFGMRRRNDFMSGDPSWLPDYHVKSTDSQYAWGEGQRFKIIKFLGDQSGKNCPNPPLSNPKLRLLDHGTLVLDAVKVDTIENLWGVCDPLDKQSEVPGILLEWIINTVGLKYEWPTNITELDGQDGDKVWRAFINNCLPDGDEYRSPTQEDYDQIKTLSSNISALRNDLKIAALKHTPGLAYHFIICLWKRRMVKTRSGLIGLAPEAAHKADEIWVPHGSSIPFILRPCCNNTAYAVIGTPFLHGLKTSGYTAEQFEEVSLH